MVENNNSAVPSIDEYDFKDLPIEVGIDEAGRGPVLGPMVYGVAFWPVDIGEEMRNEFCFTDSKKLTEGQRDHMFSQIQSMDKTKMGYFTCVLDPSEISNDMLAEDLLGGRNLNRMSYDAAFSTLLKILKMGFKVQRVICDQVGPPDKQERELRAYCYGHLKDGVEVICESKADDTYPVVSAASICAKVTRDTILKEWAFKEQ